LLLVGLTGGIGSGKSYVGKIFETLGIAVYYADKEAKRLMIQDKRLKCNLKDLLGGAAYHRNGRLNRAFVAGKIFKNKTLLEKVNQLVHPAVKDDFLVWAESQVSPYVMEESAILFENGLNTGFDSVILVTADEDIRIARVMKRDKVTEQQVRSRMKQQLPDEKKLILANFVIRNNGTMDLEDQIQTVHAELLELSKS